MSSMPTENPARELTVIEPEAGWMRLDLKEIWKYRDLLQLMVWRDISARYRQSVLGIGWAIFRPLISAMIFTLVFSVLVKVKTEIPYPIFAFSALIPWMYFSTSLAAVTNSVAAAQSLLTKVYFPKTILPIAAVCPGLVEVLIQLVILALFMAWYGFLPTWRILALPAFIALAVLTAFSFGIWLTALNVKYRDVGMAVPFLIQIWMYLCPIVYPISIVPEKYLAIYSLNPMVGVIEGFRWSVLGTASPQWISIFISMAVVIAILVTGLYYFRRVESRFADVI
ncbi:ABC transporter permease [Pseudomonadota bacterium]